MKIAIILFNLGGPDTLSAVQPFLKNLFSDPAIIGLPTLFRLPLAHLISSRRTPTAKAIYEQMGGGSLLVPETKAQAKALTEQLQTMHPEIEWKTVLCMRYWHPMIGQAIKEAEDFKPDRIVLLPLYPQFSTTTTGSSVKQWQKAQQKSLLAQIPTTTLCCYPQETHFISAHADQIRSMAQQMHTPFRLLFSAHGLPEKIIQAGDPYQWQVEQTAAATLKLLGNAVSDWQICYQSRVGPLKWIGPSTEEEIHRAGKEGMSLLVTPIAFVSEHSETLVELDIEYAHLAKNAGVPEYKRVPALSVHPRFIQSLAAMLSESMAQKPGTIQPDSGRRICPPEFTQCPCRTY